MSIFSMKTICRIFALGKFCLALCVVILLIVPLNVYRSDIPDISFKMKFNFVLFKFHHHFCMTPNVLSHIKISDVEIYDSLNLPKNTGVSPILREFGECRAKLSRIKMDQSFCLCKFRLSYAIVFVIALSALLIEFINSGFLSLKTKNFYAEVLIRVFVCSLIVAATISSFESIWVYKMILPGQEEETNYFENPKLWYVAIVACVTYGVLTVIQVTVMDFDDYLDEEFEEFATGYPDSDEEAATTCDYIDEFKWETDSESEPDDRIVIVNENGIHRRTKNSSYHRQIQFWP